MIFSRRAWLQSVISMIGVPAWSSAKKILYQDNPIVEENKKEGTRAWMLSNPSVSPPHSLWHMFGLRSLPIEGYCSHSSVAAGETIDFYVSTDPDTSFSLEVFRMGYYGGLGGRLMHSAPALSGKRQVTPDAGHNRVIECQWESSYQIRIPDDWVSGVYLVKLTTQDDRKHDSYCIFIVRDERPCDYLFQCSDMTWQAYNRWPYNNSLYCTDEIDWHIGEGVDVSTRRPYAKYTQLVDQNLTLGSGEWFLTEFPFAFWMEKEGYDVSYISNWDTHYRCDQLMRTKGFLSIGHDEYWTEEMYTGVKNCIKEGLNVGFFSGNSVFCKIKLKPGIDGTPDIIYERNGRFEPRENTLIGAHSHKIVVGGADFICKQPNHWIFAGTGMQAEDRIPGLIGWEFHCDPADIDGLEVIAGGPTDNRRFLQPDEKLDKEGEYMVTVYPGPRGNFVFNASTCWWADGLSEPPGYKRSNWYQKRFGPDDRVIKMTQNILSQMLT